MLFVTGSPVSDILENILKRHHKSWPALKNSPLHLSCFLGPLPVLGRIPMRVQRDQTIVRSVLIIVYCEGTLVSFRNTIQTLNNANVSLLEAGMSPHVNVLREDAQFQNM